MLKYGTDSDSENLIPQEISVFCLFAYCESPTKFSMELIDQSLLSQLEDQDVSLESLPDSVPLLPLRDSVVFPHTLYPILVGRDASVKAVDDAMAGDRLVMLCAQFDPTSDAPAVEEIRKIGTFGQIVQVLKLPNNLMKVLVRGLSIANIEKVTQTEPYTRVKLQLRPTKTTAGKKLDNLMRKVKDRFGAYVLTNTELPEEILLSFDHMEEPESLIYYVASHMDLDLTQRQSLLEISNTNEQLGFLLGMINSELELLTMTQEISDRVQEEMQDNQRKFFIQEQIKMLQDELDEDDFGDPEQVKIKETVDKLDLPEPVRVKAIEELTRLKKTPTMSPEYSVSRNWLDWLISLPWGTYTKDRLDIKTVEDALNAEHYGIEKAKERILEHIAVLNLVQSMKGQILCFVGPPGTGKTSLAKSIANAIGRSMVRIALGGVHDEAEIRGHRKTYIGAMPGRIIQAMKKSGSMNPVIILDEIDKLSNNYHGDPSSAVLEVLDPEQNNSFADHYMDVEFDLSQVMFITTANVASEIQPALLDRMELISLPGYLEYDKLEIAKNHLIPKLLVAHGLKATQAKFKDDAILKIIREYTSEAGVRALEQQLAACCRKLAKRIVLDRQRGEKTRAVTINAAKVVELLGVEKFRDRTLDRHDKIGSVNGLAWTSTGGTVLEIDVARMRGKNKFTLTGQLGDVMKESAQAALTYIRAHSDHFGLEEDFFEKNELHIHIPEGAIPKDGPSAGLAMALAMISLLRNRKVRHDLAMTGEITLRGEVYAIGGLNEKLLAAQRNKIKTVLIPYDNLKDLIEIPEKVKFGLEIIGVKTLDEAMPHVFRN
jgi:ATP-dependent Lon protease